VAGRRGVPGGGRFGCMGAREGRARSPTGATGVAVVATVAAVRGAAGVPILAVAGAGAATPGRVFSDPVAMAVRTSDVPGFSPTIERRARARASDAAVGVVNVLLPPAADATVAVGAVTIVAVAVAVGAMVMVGVRAGMGMPPNEARPGALDRLVRMRGLGTAASGRAVAATATTAEEEAVAAGGGAGVRAGRERRAGVPKRPVGMRAASGAAKTGGSTNTTRLTTMGDRTRGAAWPGARAVLVMGRAGRGARLRRRADAAAAAAVAAAVVVDGARAEGGGGNASTGLRTAKHGLSGMRVRSGTRDGRGTGVAAGGLAPSVWSPLSSSPHDASSLCSSSSSSSSSSLGSTSPVGLSATAPSASDGALVGACGSRICTSVRLSFHRTARTVAGLATKSRFS
jgi:hypothetical protein